jgi:hypothetical protein
LPTATDTAPPLPDYTITITEPHVSAPVKVLGNADVALHSGLLQGLRISGFVLWRATAKNGKDFVAVTLPARPRKDAEGAARYYEFIQGSPDQIRHLKKVLVEAYEAHVAATAKRAVA